MLKYDRINTKTKIVNPNQLSIWKRTKPINLHGKSSARLLRTFVSAEYLLDAYFIKTIRPAINEQLENDILTLF